MTSIRRAGIMAAVITCVFLAAPQSGQPQTQDKQPKAESEQVTKLFEAMRKGEYKGLEFPKLALSDVPALLELADSTTLLKSIPSNPLSSIAVFECREGVMALWLIEGIRKGGKYASLVPICLKTGEQGVKGGTTSEATQQEAAKAYREWWRRAKSLQPEDAMKLEPFKGTELRWR